MKTAPLVRPLLCAALLCVGGGTAASAEPEGQKPDGYMTSNMPAYDAGDASAAPVTAANLLESERFWPYHASVTGDWKPASGRRPSASGVLIRVEPDGARIDFGRDGLHTVPVAATDVVENANRVRTGELDKKAPNFVLAMGPRLLDAATTDAYTFQRLAQGSGFLAVFADPGEAGFVELARALAPLQGRHGVLTIVFPQGRTGKASVRERLREAGWNGPFVYPHLSRGYTLSLLKEGTPTPWLQLQTREGRLLYQGPARAAGVAEISAALDAHFGEGPAAASTGGGPGGES